MWWYFCGARSYAAMRRIQPQILVVASGHAVPAYGQEGQVDVLPVPELPAGSGDLGQQRGQFGVGLAAVRDRPRRAAGERNLLVRH